LNKTKGCLIANFATVPDQLGALGLVTNAVVLWNTLYMQEALSHLRSAGEIPEDEHISRLSPLMYGHINMLAKFAQRG
jgi:hypothetical protein